jgi:hypothetical protein
MLMQNMESGTDYIRDSQTMTPFGAFGVIRILDEVLGTVLLGCGIDSCGGDDDKQL